MYFLQQYKQKYALGLSLLCIVVMLLSLYFIKLRGLLSVSMIVFSANTILFFISKENCIKFVKSPVYMGFTSLFFLVLVSGINTKSYNVDAWLVWLRLKLPFLFMPLAFYVLPKVSRSVIHRILLLFLYASVLIGLACFINYFIHFKQITESYLHAKIMPLPTEHIRFSVMIAMAFFVGIYFLYNATFKQYRLIQKSIWVGVVFLFIFIHVLSVRSGLLSLYSGILLSLAYYIFFTKKYSTAVVGLIFIVALPLLAYAIVPSFRNKIKYMRHDLSQFANGKDVRQFSDSRRIISFKGGLESWRNHFWFGVGYGDIREEMFAYYDKNFPSITDDYDRILPHNQFLWTAMGAGFIGLLWLIIVLILPLFSIQNTSNPLFGVFYSSQIISFMFEHTIEAQIGTAFFLIYMLLILYYNSLKA